MLVPQRTIKSDRKDFEQLLNGLDPIHTPSPVQDPQPSEKAPKPTPVDNTSAAETMKVKMFDYDYDLNKKILRKKARKTILGAVKHIMSDDLLEYEYVKDKIEQDIDTLTSLYVQLDSNMTMQRSIMENVNSGNSAPRMYEVFAQLTDKIQAITKQIFESEQRIRKTYIDLKFEIRDKEGEANIAAQQQKDPAKLEAPTSMVVTSTKNLISGARQRHIDKINNVKEAEFEIKDW